MRLTYKSSSCVLSNVALVLLMLGLCPAPGVADDFHWTGQCAGEWHTYCYTGDYCDPPDNEDPELVNNWGRVTCQSDGIPPIPGADDNAYFLSGVEGTVETDAVALNVTIDPDNSLRILPSYYTTNLWIGGTLSNDGLLTVNPSQARSSALLFADGAQIQGTGEIFMNQYGTGARLEGSTVTQAAGHTIRGRGQIIATLANEGLVSADLSGSVLELLTSDKTNDGTIEACDGGFLELNAITLTQGPTGEILADAGTWQLWYGGTIVGGTLHSANDGQITVPGNGGSGALQDVTIASDGYVAVRGSYYTSELYLRGSVLTNDGALVVNPGDSYTAQLVVENDVTVQGTGEIFMNQYGTGAQLNTNPGVTLTNATGHTIHGRGQINAALINNGSVSADVSAQTLTVNPQDAGVTNSGTLIASANCELEINNAALFTQTAGETVVDGTLDVNGAPLDLQGGRLSGTGIVAGSVNNAGARVEPGGSAGTLTISGDYSQGSDATLRIEIGGPTPGDEYDVLNVTGTANLDGELRVDPINDYLPDVGTEFTILTAASVDGEFAEVTGPGQYTVTYNATDVTLTVGVPPIPGDLDGDGCVGHSDLGILLADWNCTGGDCIGDCDGDGDTDHSDLGILLAHWGQGCP